MLPRIMAVTMRSDTRKTVKALLSFSQIREVPVILLYCYMGISNTETSSTKYVKFQISRKANKGTISCIAVFYSPHDSHPPNTIQGTNNSLKCLGKLRHWFYIWKTKYSILKNYSFVLGVTPSGAWSLLVSPCSKMIPDSTWGTICDARD